MTRTQSSPVCPECGYSLDGLDKRGACPECGQAYTPEKLAYNAVRRKERRPRILHASPWLSSLVGMFVAIALHGFPGWSAIGVLTVTSYFAALMISWLSVVLDASGRYRPAWVYALTLSMINAFVTYACLWEFMTSSDALSGFALGGPVFVWPLAVLAFFVAWLFPSRDRARARDR